MNDCVTGGCLCGFVRYEYSGELRLANYCHCNDCRKTTGSAFNIGIKVDALKLRVITGHVKSYTKTAGSGNTIAREFCPECGSPLFTRAFAKPEFVWIKAGSLDDPTLVKPTYQIWSDRAVPWAYIDADLPSFPGNRTVVETNDAQPTVSSDKQKQ
ncbi:GFA family protein [Scytonema sp. NUACC26]|uniref:GFA family protein n=1 Tax=Scytonema sp. NUACC26 TaxID=3140176 RepID=UPI0038B3B778